MNRNVFQQALILLMATVDPDEDAISDILQIAGIDRAIYEKTVRELADEIFHSINTPRVDDPDARIPVETKWSR